MVSVVDDDRRPVGIVTRTDLLREQTEDTFEPSVPSASLEPGFHEVDLATRLVRDVMARCVHALPEGAPIIYAMSLMGSGTLTVPVVGRDWRVVGVLTSRDVFAWLTRQLNPQAVTKGHMDIGSSPEEPKHRISRTERGKTRIFVADDDDAFRAILRKIFTLHGYEVTEASDGADALEMLAAAADGEAEEPDVIVLDVNMPGYSGLGVLRAMRRFPRRPPTILVTAFEDASVDVLAQGFGAVCVLHKPLDVHQLLAAIRDIAHAA